MSYRDRQLTFKLAEYAAIAATTAGIIISVIFNQSLYALIPMAIWLLISFFSRQLLTQQVTRLHRETLEVQQHLEVALPIIAQLPGWEQTLSQIPQVLQNIPTQLDQLPSQTDVQQLQKALAELKTNLAVSQEQQHSILDQEAQFTQYIAQLQEQVQQLQRDRENLNSQDMLKTRSPDQNLTQRLAQVEMALGITPQPQPKSPELPFDFTSNTGTKLENYKNSQHEIEDDDDLIQENLDSESKTENIPNLSDFLDIVDSEEDDEDLLEAELHADEAFHSQPPPTAFPESK